MFGGGINFGVMQCPQLFYNKSYAKSCYWSVEKKIVFGSIRISNNLLH